jgi:hypothetical protein
MPSLSQLKQLSHSQPSRSFAPHKLHGRFNRISDSIRIFFTQHSDLGHETQSGWGWSGSPGSPKAGSSLVTSKRGEAVRPNEPPDWRRGRSGVKVTFLCVFPTWIFKPFSDLKVFMHWSHLKTPSLLSLLGPWAPPQVGPSGSPELSSFFFKNSDLLLAFLRKVDGVFFFFLVLP